jgi:hypothetical protein
MGTEINMHIMDTFISATLEALINRRRVASTSHLLAYLFHHRTRQILDTKRHRRTQPQVLLWPPLLTSESLSPPPVVKRHTKTNQASSQENRYVPLSHAFVGLTHVCRTVALSSAPRTLPLHPQYNSSTTPLESQSRARRRRAHLKVGHVPTQSGNCQDHIRGSFCVLMRQCRCWDDGIILRIQAQQRHVHLANTIVIA